MCRRKPPNRVNAADIRLDGNRRDGRGSGIVRDQAQFPGATYGLGPGAHVELGEELAAVKLLASLPRSAGNPWVIPGRGEHLDMATAVHYLG